jgi:glycosyltransferase involved in cell wall biosynthesis
LSKPRTDEFGKANEGHEPKKRRLAVVTTYDDLCGIAGFSRSLVRALEPHFDVEVFDLDQFLLRLTDRLGRQKGDLYFKSICRQLREFDVVNLQLEFGTLGTLERDIFRRMEWLCRAAPELSVTFHTVPRLEAIDWAHIGRLVGRFRFSQALTYYMGVSFQKSVARTYSLLRKTARRKPLSLIVHTRRDRRYLEVVHDFKKVYDHPLSFLQADETETVLEQAKRTPFASLTVAPEGTVSVGVFGFLSPYKGFETAIRAMRYLPPNYHLYIFGGVHPNDIMPKRMHSYVMKLIREVSSDFTLLDRLTRSPSRPDDDKFDNLDDETAAKPTMNLSLGSIAEAEKLVQGQMDSLLKRVHFVGALSDEEFFVSVASCDVVVLPYHEVMQSSSGPASIAIELGRRTVLSRTKGFLQLGRYFPKRLEYFDIGNHLQLVSILTRPVAAEAVYPKPAVSMETLARMYVSINGGTYVEPADRGEAPVVTVDGLQPSRSLTLSLARRVNDAATDDHRVTDDAVRAEKRSMKRLFRKRSAASSEPAGATDRRSRPH